MNIYMFACPIVLHCLAAHFSFNLVKLQYSVVNINSKDARHYFDIRILLQATYVKVGNAV
jgi:hypothetical protein